MSKRKRASLAATVTFCLLAGAASAGELTVEVFSRTQVAATANVSSDDPNLAVAGPNGGKWTFDLRSQPTISMSVRIVVEDLPAGYQSVPMRFALPFFADRGRPYALATAVVNDPIDDLNGIAPFLKEMGGSGSTFGNSFLLYQRASRLWKARQNQLRIRNANSDDVAIAYWLLYAVADLARQYYYQPDDLVREAARWMSGLPQDEPLYRRVSRTTIDNLLLQMGGIEVSIYEAVISRLERDRDGSRDFVCSRFRRLDSDFGELTEPEKKQLDPSGRLTVKIKENVTWCAAQLASSGSVLTDQQRNELHQTITLAKEALSAVPAMTQVSRNARFVEDNIQVIESFVGVVP